jgi:hypothetical protein
MTISHVADLCCSRCTGVKSILKRTCLKIQHFLHYLILIIRIDALIASRLVPKVQIPEKYKQAAFKAKIRGKSVNVSGESVND